MVKSNKGISIIESLVCLVVIGIGFIAVMQLSAFTLGSMDRATEKNKLNYLSEMILEDMIGDPDNASSYDSFNETCASSNTNKPDLHEKKKDKWRDKLKEKNFIRVDGKDKKLPCFSGDTKKTFVIKGAQNTTGRINFLTGKTKRKKYLGVVIK
jgi:type II secretory pathway pseudopilin PulG